MSPRNSRKEALPCGTQQELRPARSEAVDTGEQPCQGAVADGLLTKLVHLAEPGLMLFIALPKDTPAEAAHEF